MQTTLQIQLEQIADGLSGKGFAIIDNFLSKGEVENILSTDEFRNSKLHFKKAGVGKPQSRQIIESIRGDYIQWIDPSAPSMAIRVYTDRVYTLIHYINQQLFLSLKDVELHMTLYPVGTFYKRHLDQFKSDDHRKLSVICYLNVDWKAEQGGQLRMHLPEGSLDVYPESGRLVCFRSDLIEHEVMPASRERLSLTGWMVDQQIS